MKEGERGICAVNGICIKGVEKSVDNACRVFSSLNPSIAQEATDIWSRYVPVQWITKGKV